MIETLGLRDDLGFGLGFGVQGCLTLNPKPI